MKALTDNGFTIPENLTKEKSNLKGDKHYDQIGLHVTDNKLEIGASGVFKFQKSVFRDGDKDFDAYFEYMPPKLRDFHTKGSKKGQPRNRKEQKDYYEKEWRTWQISDHQLMWAELKTDFTTNYLKGLKSN